MKHKVAIVTGASKGICECVFRNEGALEAALASPEVAAVMADVPRFTALAPQRLRVAAL